jgi:glycosyltransferase involved in cell wall biosynthesis
MRLTLINQFYPPDLAPTGHMAASVAEHRAEIGDLVTVIASQGGYAAPRSSRDPRASTNPRVIRLWTPRLGRARWIARLIDYGVFFLLAVVRMAMLPRQDVIVALTTPPYIVLTALLHRLLHPSAKVVLWVMDCYPEVLERDRLIRSGGLMSRMMGRLNRAIFARISHLVCLDAAMQQLQSERYGPSVATIVIPNWEPESAYPIDASPHDWKTTDGLDLDGKLIVLYLGNAGLGHRFETVVKAASAMEQESVAFVFVGGGEKWAWLGSAKHSNGLRNLHLLDYVEKEATPALLAAADCSLITLRDEYLGVISPSKLHASLAMGRPVIYIGPVGGNVDTAIQRHRVGISLRHGDVDGLVAFIRKLKADESMRADLRRRAREAFLSHYSDSRALSQFDSLFASLDEYADVAPES